MVVALLMIIRLLRLQLLDESYKAYAQSNLLGYETQYPAWGLIYDKNGTLLVYNQAAYDLMIIPDLLEPFDTVDFCNILDISKEELLERLNNIRTKRRSYQTSPFLEQISSLTYAVLQEKLYKYPGFFVQTRTLRKYPYVSSSHLLGYVGEVDKYTVDNNAYYKSGDYIGHSGLEKAYEEDLRGRKGVKVYLKDVLNRTKGSYEEGKFDTVAVVGKNIQLTIDLGLQEYGELLMKNKIGSIVAIEPKTGEVLSFISLPDYDPNLLVGRVRTKNYLELLRDSLNPLFNRAVMAQYPPGSTFKTIQGLIALQEGVVRPYFEYSCYGGYYGRRASMGCHAHNSPLDLKEAIQNSCNTYFAYVFKNILENPKYENHKIAFDKWAEHLRTFGFGSKLGIDFTSELNGLVPSSDLYNKKYKGSWNFETVMSLSIGQGEMLTTPVQMANMTAILANRGHYYTPHIVKKIQEKESIDDVYLEKRKTSIDSIHFSPIVEGMYLAVNGAPGTGGTAGVARIPGIDVCGKTGTAENPHGKDHSIFIAFAPKDNPKIAIAVYVENGGYGSTWAAPIASLLIEKYLTGTVKRTYLEDRMINANLLDRRAKEE